MSRLTSTLALTLPLLALPVVACAQDWRTTTAARQHAGEDLLRVDVEYGIGRLRITPASGKELYRATVRYDAEKLRPEISYRDQRLTVDLEGHVHARNHKGGRLDLALGRDVPIELDLKFGAGEADVELGGLRIRDADVATGASQTRLRFSAPNPERCRALNIAAGAAEFKAYGIGNLNTDRLTFDGGVGDIMLDFTGAWQTDMTAHINMGLGSLTLRVPRALGVRVTRNAVLASFDSEGLVKRGRSYYSENWDTAQHKLSISIDAAFGSIDVVWVDDGTV